MTALEPAALVLALAQSITSETLLEAVVRILAFGLLAATTAATAAVTFRWYSADEIPEGVAILLGISPVALWLNTQTALQDAIIGTSGFEDPETAVYTIAAFTAGAIAADGGRRVGDHLARDVFSITAPRTIDEVGQLVRSAGRVVTVELPDEIDDLEGYDPVDEETKATLAGQTFLLPRRLDDEELRERLIDRLEHDYGIGHVDVELADDRTIEYLAVGSRPAGIGPTLAPGSVAVAIRADPAPDASPGDAVRIWLRDENGSVRRLAEGELRGTADDVATVAVDDASAFPADAEYRVVTRPGTPGTERELVSLLRTADDTVTTLSVDGTADDSLAGLSVGSLPVLVLVLERGGGDAVGLPSDDVRLEAGDTAYVLGRPDALRRLAERDEQDASRNQTGAAPALEGDD